MPRVPSSATASTVAPIIIVNLSKMQNAEGFEMFKKFPAEIQSLVWEEAVHQTASQLVVLRSNNLPRNYDGPDTDYHYCKSTYCKHAQKPPVLLHTCQQSRRAALKRYDLCFVDQLSYPLYFDLKLDTLLFPNVNIMYDFMSYFELPELLGEQKDRSKVAKLRKIAFVPIEDGKINFENMVEGISIAEMVRDIFLPFLPELRYVKLLKPSAGAYDDGILQRYTHSKRIFKKVSLRLESHIENNAVVFEETLNDSYADTEEMVSGEYGSSLQEWNPGWKRIHEDFDWVLPATKYETYEEMQDCRLLGDGITMIGDQKHYCEEGEEWCNDDSDDDEETTLQEEATAAT